MYCMQNDKHKQSRRSPVKLVSEHEESPAYSSLHRRAYKHQIFIMERVAKRFFERFQSEYEQLLPRIEGLTTQKDRTWYALIMLNRLMFVYFIQNQGFLNTKSHDGLDGDTAYLRHRLQLLQEQQESGT